MGRASDQPGKIDGRAIPEMPLSPMVRLTQRKARPQITIPSASVIMRK